MVTSMTSMHGPCIKTTRTLNTKSPTPIKHARIRPHNVSQCFQWMEWIWWSSKEKGRGISGGHTYSHASTKFQANDKLVHTNEQWAQKLVYSMAGNQIECFGSLAINVRTCGRCLLWNSKCTHCPNSIPMLGTRVAGFYQWHLFAEQERCSSSLLY